MSGLSRTEMKHIEISPEALAQLGDGEIAYVKTIRSEDVHALFPQVPEIEPGLKLFALHAADGTPIMLTDFARSRVRQRGKPAARNGERSLTRPALSDPSSKKGPALCRPFSFFSFVPVRSADLAGAAGAQSLQIELIGALTFW